MSTTAEIIELGDRWAKAERAGDVATQRQRAQPHHRLARIGNSRSLHSLTVVGETRLSGSTRTACSVDRSARLDDTAVGRPPSLPGPDGPV
jgi:hypothetical protein